MSEQEDKELPEFFYSSVEDWFINLFAKMIERRLDAAGAGTLTWCPQWWKHDEAIARLEGLWRAWEVCRDTDGEAPSRWFWMHCDPMLAVLMDAKTGPLSDCKPDAHRKYQATTKLPYTRAPAGYWGKDVVAIA